MLKTILIESAVIILLGVVIFFLIKDRIKLKEKNKKLQDRLDSVKNNLTQVIDYTEVNNSIEEKQDIIKSNMKDKTDEEKTNVINNIVDIFNNSEL